MMRGFYVDRIHPLLFSLAPILALVAHNTGDVRLSQAGWVLGVAAVAALLLQAFSSWVCRGAVRGAMVTSMLVVLFFLYGHAFDWIRSAGWVKTHTGIHGWVGGVAIGLLLVWIIWVCRTRRDLVPVSRGLTVVSCVLVVMAVFNVVRGSLAGGEVRSERSKRAAIRAPAAQAEATAARPVPPLPDDDPARPDVYYLLLDGYARADVLRAVHGFDNTEFLNQLRSRGFQVAEKSYSNYAYTHFSLASSLNMDYVENVFSPASGRESGRGPSYRAIRNPRVGRRFQARGYRFLHFATNWGGTEDSDAADMVLRERPKWLQQEFMEVLIRSTALRFLEPNVADIHRFEFRKLRELPSLRGPKFVFAHFLVPHKPYVFDRFGNVRKDVPLALQWKDNDGGWQNRQAYVEQLRFVNDQILKSIDGILAGSRSRPWIILQSDHGTAALQAYGKGVPGEPATDAFIRERFGNFTAVLAPGNRPMQLPEPVTPVNLFRFVLNAMFDEGLEILPDRHYLGSRRDRFQEVGDILRRAELDAGAVRKILEDGAVRGPADATDDP